ncbi:hypothetical protein D9619_007129 [Psilocybe cf. subviscida]|uniref:Phosphodiest-domain-containing protein n=1 Tax=Psilocybe cf. subviscida TaxID=2480587 RepID=A0A8H5B2S7_9AGAR|nr:hypothetical protein D9619_007129 [Psilocybe cf. subviscida]
MASGSHSSIHTAYSAADNDTEERKALLNARDEEAYDSSRVKEDVLDAPSPAWSRRKIVTTAAVLIGLLLTGTLARTVLFSRPIYNPQRVHSDEVLLSNGTDLFRRTVLIVSIDGLRADYLDRGLTPHLLNLSKKGIRAKSMKPIFPADTGYRTGLHAESHGIVANNFWEPTLEEEFHYNQLSSAWNSVFWLGEPMWETAEKAGVITANLMWPGPPKTTTGASSTYFVPWKNKVPLDVKLDQILRWIDLPFDQRPQLIMAYEPSLDQAGHATGPYSARVNASATLVQVDEFARDLHDTLASRNLTDIVDIVFVSDHGMTDTSHPEYVFMDKVLGAEGIKAIEHEDGWPSMGLRFREGTNVSQHLEALLHASDSNPEKFEVFTHDTMPERYHFAHHERIAPIYVVPKIGYVLTMDPEHDDPMSKGNHGYDNEEPSMQAIFVAHGPFSIEAKAQHQQTAHLARSTSKGWHSTSQEDGYVMQPFANVEIYNLVMKLLGISDKAAPTNAQLDEVLRTNGTDLFKRTVLLVSIDGFRADYLDRGLTPHILRLSKTGIRAKSMKPIFPTLTFPNHWALLTGLHAETHGMVANDFWDPASKQKFHYSKLSSIWNPIFWLGEPMWETAERAGIKTANLMWVGPPKTITGVSSTYFVPWKNEVPLSDKVDQILRWIDLPFNERPQLIMAYEPSLDQAGHDTGPYSALVNTTLAKVDEFARDLYDSLASRNLTDIVDVIFVSDHGMADMSHPEYVSVDQILGAEGVKAIEHEDGWPSMGLRFHEGTNVSQHLEALLLAADRDPEKFEVFTHETMPERYHYGNHERIAPIYVVPKIGYALTMNSEHEVPMSNGNHGYDNDESSMQAIFVAHGPFSIEAKVQHQQTAHLVRSTSKGWHSTSQEDGYVMQPFANVEIYNLVMKLLGISDKAAPTNGTAGFWDQYI